MCFRILSSVLFRKARLILVAMALFPASVLAQGVGSWHTSGNQILDSNNQEVRIAGINWYGFETTDEVVHGLWAQDYHAILNAIKSNGYNTVRLPYSNQMVEAPVIPANISFSNGSGSINTDLIGLNALEIMDRIITAAGTIGLRVILVNHRSEAGNSAEANGLWYTNPYPESAWINDWLTVVNRYARFTDANGNPTVIGVDLRNEPHLIASGQQTGSCWTGDTWTNGCPATNTAQNWPAAAQRAGNAILGANPNLLIIVEGTDCFDGDCDWWGGNLEGVKSNPVILMVPNRLVYSAHDYGPALFQQAWFNSSTSFSTLSGVWNKFWRYVSTNDIAPVLVGEFGTDNNSSDIQSSSPGSQGQWFQALVDFLQNDPLLNWTTWALNGEDSYALLDSQYDPTPLSPLKQDMLASVQFQLGGAGGTGGSCMAAPAAPSSLSVNAVSSTQINLSWTIVTPPANCSIAYKVFRGTFSGFTPSSGNEIASGLSSPSFANTGLASSTTYYYAVEVADAAGASAPSNQVAATTNGVSGGVACHVVYNIVNQWNTGFQAAITLENTGTADITSWTLAFTFPGNQQINGLWNGVDTQIGEAVTVNNLNYNGTIPAHGSYAGIGFTASYAGPNPAPAVFSVNGTACH